MDWKGLQSVPLDKNMSKTDKNRDAQGKAHHYDDSEYWGENENRNRTCSWIGRLSIKMSDLSDYTFNTISIEIFEGYCLNSDKVILKFILKNQSLLNFQMY